MFSMSKGEGKKADQSEIAAYSAISQMLNPFDMSDEQIKKQIYETDGRPDDSFDADDLFVIVENLLKRSIQIVDEVMQGDAGKLHQGKLDESSPKANFRVPMANLKKIGSEDSLSYN